MSTLEVTGVVIGVTVISKVYVNGSDVTPSITGGPAQVVGTNKKSIESSGIIPLTATNTVALYATKTGLNPLSIANVVRGSLTIVRVG